MIGSTILQYKILKKLGGEGMGLDYKTNDTMLMTLTGLYSLSPTYFSPIVFQLNHTKTCPISATRLI